MLGTIIFLSLFLLLLNVMLSIEVYIKLDVNSNSLIVTIKIFKLKIVTINIDIIGFHYSINNSKKLKSLSLILPKEQEYLIKQIKSSILDKLYYDSIEFVSSINNSDPAQTANFVGLLNIICFILKNYFLTMNSDLKIEYLNTANFIEKNNEVSLKIKVYFTIFDMIFALIMSFYKRGRYVKQKKQTK